MAFDDIIKDDKELKQKQNMLFIVMSAKISDEREVKANKLRKAIVDYIKKKHNIQ